MARTGTTLGMQKAMALDTLKPGTYANLNPPAKACRLCGKPLFDSLRLVHVHESDAMACANANYPPRIEAVRVRGRSRAVRP